MLFGSINQLINPVGSKQRWGGNRQFPPNTNRKRTCRRGVHLIYITVRDYGQSQATQPILILDTDAFHRFVRLRSRNADRTRAGNASSDGNQCIGAGFPLPGASYLLRRRLLFSWKLLRFVWMRYLCLGLNCCYFWLSASWEPGKRTSPPSYKYYITSWE